MRPRSAVLDMVQGRRRLHNDRDAAHIVPVQACCAQPHRAQHEHHMKGKPAKERRMYDRILAAIDATPQAQSVLAETRRLADLTGGSVHILHVWAVHAELHSPMLLGAPLGAPLGSLPKTWAAEARQVVDRAVAQLAEAGVKVEGEVLRVSEDKAAEAVLTRARELHAQLIVLGVRHRKRLAAWRRPSVADHVCHYPCCPVLIVP
jgi:nucleotide-binding universal stress UspA family protein